MDLRRIRRGQHRHSTKKARQRDVLLSTRDVRKFSLAPRKSKYHRQISLRQDERKHGSAAIGGKKSTSSFKREKIPRGKKRGGPPSEAQRMEDGESDAAEGNRQAFSRDTSSALIREAALALKT